MDSRVRGNDSTGKKLCSKVLGCSELVKIDFRRFMLAAVLFSLSCGSLFAEEATKSFLARDSVSEEPTAREEAILMPHDKLSIEVFPQQDLNTVKEIGADGTITFPYVQSIMAGGLTEQQFSKRLQAALEEKYLKNPSVVVKRTFSSAEDSARKGLGAPQQPIMVFGQVNNKGNYQPTRPSVTLSEVIAASGGFFDDADGVHTQLVRNTAAGPVVNVIDVPSILNGLAPDFTVMAGDIINVPSKTQNTAGGSDWLKQIQDPLTLMRTTVNPIKVFGEVNLVGPHYPMRNDVTLSEVIALQGGYTKQADIARIKLVRVINKKEVAEQINLYDFFNAKRSDPVLKPGDLVIIPPFEQPIQAIGEVEKPGAVTLDHFLGRTPTLIPAISAVGGFKKSAALRRVRIVRVINDKEQSIKVNVKKIFQGKKKDVILEPGDIIVVPESFW